MPDEQHHRIGVGAAAEPCAHAIHHRIGADRHRGEQRKTDGLAIEPRQAATASQRQQQDASDQQQDAAPTEQTEPLVNEGRRRDCGHQRRRSACNRVHLSHVSGAVALDQRREIHEVDQHRGRAPWPCGDGRQAGHRQEYQRDNGRSDRNQDRRRQRIEPALDGRVPSGMACGGEQDGDKDERIHGQKDSARLRALVARRSWSAAIRASGRRGMRDQSR